MGTVAGGSAEGHGPRERSGEAGGFRSHLARRLRVRSRLGGMACPTGALIRRSHCSRRVELPVRGELARPAARGDSVVSIHAWDARSVVRAVAPQTSQEDYLLEA